MEGQRTMTGRDDKLMMYKHALYVFAGSRIFGSTASQ